MLYFCIAPLEDLLAGSMGTVAKYIALIIVAFGFIEMGLSGLKLSFSKTNVCIMWLMALGVISCVWAIDSDVAIGRISAYLTVPGICLFVGMLDFSKKEYKAIVNSAILGGLFTVMYISYVNGADLLLSGRITLNSENDPNNLAALLFLPLGLVIGKMQSVSSTGKKVWYAFCMSIIAFLFLLTGSRGGLLGLLAFFIAYLIFNKAYKKIYVLIGAIVAVVIIWFVVAPMLPEDIYNRLFNNTDFTGSEATGSGRVEIWVTLVTKIVFKNFFIGVGAGCVPRALGEYFGSLAGAHNTYLNMLGEYGVLGLPAFLIMLYDKWKGQYCAKRYIEAALLVGICVIMFFLDSYPKKFFWNVIMLLIISEKAFRTQNSEKLQGEKQ